MKILVVSDTHKKHENLLQVCEELRPDRIYHLGDGEGCEDEIEAICDCPLEIVRGNCDLYSSLPDEITLSVGKETLFLTHGHYYQPRRGLEALVTAARQKGAGVVLYGHTHCPQLLERNGITVLNPGSISFPRQSSGVPTFALIEVDETGNLQFSLHELEEG